MSLAAVSVSVSLRGRRVLDEVSLAAEPGTVLAMLGPNGAGKSTLLRVLAGLLPPDTGYVAVDGRALPARRPAALARRIGYLPQDAQCHWPLAVRDVVALGRLPHRRAWLPLAQEDQRAVEAAMRYTDVTHLAGRPADELSGGERARVLLARVLAGEPDIVLADEPVAGLDPAHQIDVMHLLARLAARGACVLVVLHDLGLAARHAQRVCLMGDGKVLALGAAAQVMTAEALRACFGITASIASIDGVPCVVARESVRREA